MYSLPSKLKGELQSRFEFTQEFTDEKALFHPMEQGRFFICIPPPLKSGLSEVLIRKALGAKAELVVLLLPCDTSTDWFHQVWKSYTDETWRRMCSGQEWCDDDLPIDIEFFNGRIKWEEDREEQSRWKNRVASCLVIIRRNDNH